MNMVRSASFALVCLIFLSVVGAQAYSARIAATRRPFYMTAPAVEG